MDLLVLSLGAYLSYSLSGRYSQTYKCCVLFTGYCRKGREGGESWREEEGKEREEKREQREGRKEEGGGGVKSGRRVWGLCRHCPSGCCLVCAVSCDHTPDILHLMAAMQPVWLPWQPCDRGGPCLCLDLSGLLFRPFPWTTDIFLVWKPPQVKGHFW